MFLKDINVLPQEEWTNKNKPLVCSFKERQVEDAKGKFLPKRNIWKANKSNMN